MKTARVMGFLVWGVLGVGPVFPSLGASAPDPITPVVTAPRFVIKADEQAQKGFLDDPFALDAATGNLAVLRTDSASYARLEIWDLQTGRPKGNIPLGDPHPLFERVLLAPEGQGAVVIMRDASSGRRIAQHFGADGKPLGLVGPVADFAVATRAGKPILVAWDHLPAGGIGTAYSVVSYDLTGLKKLGKAHAVTITKSGEIHSPPFKAIAWRQGYTQIIGLRPGDYDAKADIRLPDKAASLDALTGLFTWEMPITDVQGFAAASDLWRRRPNRSRMLIISEDGARQDLIDERGLTRSLSLPTRAAQYDPRSLMEHEEDGALFFSFAVDPLNTEALARRKADKAFLDVFTVADGAGPATARLLLRATLDDRPAVWAHSGDFLAILRKFKSFTRGGTALEVYSSE